MPAKGSEISPYAYLTLDDVCYRQFPNANCECHPGLGWAVVCPEPKQNFKPGGSHLELWEVHSPICEQECMCYQDQPPPTTAPSPPRPQLGVPTGPVPVPLGQPPPSARLRPRPHPGAPNKLQPGRPRLRMPALGKKICPTADEVLQSLFADEDQERPLTLEEVRAIEKELTVLHAAVEECERRQGPRPELAEMEAMGVELARVYVERNWEPDTSTD
ncbi:MAG: hypothetical protein M1833_005243 [Piccolia ochrophora]|nr:MAG: hypothetical protein M1833_005243 [Piccolia ochrophora]